MNGDGGSSRLDWIWWAYVVAAAVVAGAAVLVPDRTVVAAVVAGLAVFVATIVRFVERKRTEDRDRQREAAARQREQEATRTRENTWRRALLAEIFGHQPSLAHFLESIIPAFLIRDHGDYLERSDARLDYLRTTAMKQLHEYVLGRPDFERVERYYETLETLEAMDGPPTKSLVRTVSRALGMSIHIARDLVSVDGVLSDGGPVLRVQAENFADSAERYERLRALTRVDYFGLMRFDTHVRARDLLEAEPELARSMGITIDEQELVGLPLEVRDDPERHWQPYLEAARGLLAAQ